MNIEIITGRGWKYQGPHKFKSAESAINFLRKKFGDNNIEFETAIEDDTASANIITMVCGNHKRIAGAIID